MKSHARNLKLEAAFYRSYREDARIKQHSKCAYCKEPLTAKTVTADHVVPRAKYGMDGRNNIVAACQPCNKAKGHMSVDQFKRLLSSFPHGGDRHILMAWVRRRLNTAIDRVEKRIYAAVGRKA